MGCGGTVEYLVDAVLNYPTFSEAYKVAALDVMNKIRAVSEFHGAHPGVEMDDDRARMDEVDPLHG